ncbi:DUF3288 family protein [filamentous cyanobacterium LEGE 11480]|uniref:DUF3288 family protein n=1 Tax=Romeriopsis navalis LEGE 11480 TaxID=2777977 RepID=A0A928VKP9_9CYAN|nr:DUF3288 family protein [Romeriopsis navalis]MBE9029513.1 DUF3288 family protein [Romeriopsis navalis LEGE 11480]
MAEPKPTTAMKDQQHPLWRKDRAVMDSILAGDPTDLNLAELARLKIRYQGFPGAWDIQKDLDKVLQRWQLTEESLFAKTRAIHHRGTPVYTVRGNKNEEDWS